MSEQTKTEAPALAPEQKAEDAFAEIAKGLDEAVDDEFADFIASLFNPAPEKIDPNIEIPDEKLGLRVVEDQETDISVTLTARQWSVLFHDAHNGEYFGDHPKLNAIRETAVPRLNDQLQAVRGNDTEDAA